MATADARGPGGGEEHELTGGDAAVSPAEDGPWEDEPLETGRLEFGDEEVRLPWLETDGEDDDLEGYDVRHLMVLVVLGVLALAVIGGGIWWAVHHRRDEAVVADGSVIPAPRQPYKEHPKNPGGKTFAGTGDTSFAVSEGQTRPARLGETTPPAETAPQAKSVTEPAAKESGSAAAPSDAESGVGVQVAAYSNRSQAEAGWTRLTGQYEALSGLHHRVVEGQADIGTVYRLQAMAGNLAAANALCSKLKAAGLACQVKH
jgi:hypothetical protein